MELRRKCKCVDQEQAAQQLSIIHHVGDLLRSLGACRQLRGIAVEKTESFDAGAWNKHIIVDSHVEALLLMRKDLMRFVETCVSVTNVADLFSKHCQFNFFYELFKFDVKELKNEVLFLQDSMRDLWAVALAKQAAVVDGASVAGWTAHLHDVVERKDIYESLVLNPHFNLLHATNELLMKSLKSVNKIQKDSWQFIARPEDFFGPLLVT